MGYLGEDVLKLGFGCMRLPRVKGGAVDIEQFKEMVDIFLDAGGTYFDTSRMYGPSEAAIREALVERYPRESYLLATKLPAGMGCKTAEDARALFDTSLEQLGLDYVDFYLLHNVGGPRKDLFENWNLWGYLVELKEAGKARHIGFSFHDSAAVLDEVLTAHPEAEFVQLEINYADWEHDAIQSRACYEVARKHDIPIIVMEPIRGGYLATPPEPVAELLAGVNPDMTPAEWALNFVWGLDGLFTVLSGMSTVEQMEQNLATLAAFEPLSDEEHGAVMKASRMIDELLAVRCTSCKYCMKECPQHIDIPGIFDCINCATVFDAERAKFSYGFASMSAKASECIQCGSCEAVCPQSINIIEMLEKAVELFE